MSQEYGSATINGVVNQRDGRAYQEPIGASTTEVAGSNELLNGCIGTRLSKVIKAADIARQDDNIALGTKGSAKDSGGNSVIVYWVQSTVVAAGGTAGLINTVTWTWAAGGGTDTIAAAVGIGDRVWAGVAILAEDALVVVVDEEDEDE